MSNGYKIENYDDIEHLVFHALTDPWSDARDPAVVRIAYFLSRITPLLVQDSVNPEPPLTLKSLEALLANCRQDTE